VSHGREFGAADEYEYERMADRFMSETLVPPTIECVRALMPFDRIRLDPVTRFFGVEGPFFYIKTFMVKDAYNIDYRGGPIPFMEHKRTEVR
jgi:hypothetical protein